MPLDPRSGADLYWLPLGAGCHFVRLNGREFEAAMARLEKRPPKDLYHSGLAVRVPEGVHVIATAWPIPAGGGASRGVVAEGPVGSRRVRSLRLLRYEVRRWRNGAIPDIGEAVDSPRRLTDDPAVAQRILELVPDVPTPVWGRDELRTGEMCNSKLAVLADRVRRPRDRRGAAPAGGRAPGWDEGVAVARRRQDR